MALVERYGAGARVFHWVVALVILVVLPLGLLSDALKPLNVMPLHKGLGLTLLLLAPLRLAWRVTHRIAFPPLDNPLLERAAGAVHALLYLLIVIMPLSGWVIASAGTYPLRLLGVIDWPKLAVAKGDPILGAAREVHELGGWALLALLAAHIGAALWHHLHLRDGVLRRML
ncbi:MAG TPA: cytochrome b/b6 domain-containing protein [Novosphingobium sp.]